MIKNNTHYRESQFVRTASDADAATNLAIELYKKINAAGIDAKIVVRQKKIYVGTSVKESLQKLDTGETLRAYLLTDGEFQLSTVLGIDYVGANRKSHGAALA